MTTLRIPAHEMLAGDVLDDTPGGPAWTVDSVQVIGPMVIIDFADGTSWPPTRNGMVTVHRPSHPTGRIAA